jgi:ParB-like chromosome segregation protein Spo0J
MYSGPPGQRGSLPGKRWLSAQVDVSQLVLQPQFMFRSEKSYTKKALAPLLKSIRAQGLREPLWVKRALINGEEKFIVLDGTRRTLVLQELAREDPSFRTVPVLILEGDEQELMELAIIRNVTGRTFDAIALLRSVEALRRSGMSVTQISQSLCMSKGYVSDLARITELEPLRKLVEAGELTIKAARCLLRAPDPLKALDIVERLGLSSSEIVDLTKAQAWERPDLAEFIQQKRNVEGLVSSSVVIDEDSQQLKIVKKCAFSTNPIEAIHIVRDVIDSVKLLDTVGNHHDRPLEEALEVLHRRYEVTLSEDDEYYRTIWLRLKGRFRRGALRGFGIQLAQKVSSQGFSTFHFRTAAYEVLFEILELLKALNNESEVMQNDDKS